MSFFITPLDEGGPFSGQRGVNCFGDVFPLNWLSGTVRQRKGRSEGNFWFEGWTENRIPVTYVLHVFGPLDDPWPPLDEIGTTLEMTHWEMVIGTDSRNS